MAAAFSDIRDWIERTVRQAIGPRQIHPLDVGRNVTECGRAEGKRSRLKHQKLSAALIRGQIGFEPSHTHDAIKARTGRIRGEPDLKGPIAAHACQAHAQGATGHRNRGIPVVQTVGGGGIVNEHRQTRQVTQIDIIKARVADDPIGHGVPQQTGRGPDQRGESGAEVDQVKPVRASIIFGCTGIAVGHGPDHAEVRG